MFGKWAVILVVSIFAAPIGFVMHLVFAFLLMATGNIMMLARRPRSKLAQLKIADGSLQLDLVEILEVIGTTQSISDLQVVAKGRGLGKHGAERAIRAIQARDKK